MRPRPPCQESITIEGVRWGCLSRHEKYFDGFFPDFDPTHRTAHGVEWIGRAGGGS